MSFILRARELEEILARHLTHIDRKLESLSTTVTEATANIQAALTKFGTDLTAELAALKEAIAAGQDSSANIAALDAIAAQITTLDTTVLAATPSAPVTEPAAAATSAEPAPAEAAPATA